MLFVTPRLILCSLICVNLGAIAYSQPYSVVTIAGKAGLGGSADGTNGAAQFTAPNGAALDTNGNLYLTDANAIRKCSPSGTNWIVTTLAGSILMHGTNDGTNSLAEFDSPQGLTASAAGALYVADTLNNAIRKTVLVGTNWVVTTVAGLPGKLNSGTSDGTNTAARFNEPYGICADSSGNLFVADTKNHIIRKITQIGTNWVVTTIAGSAGVSGSNDGTNLLAHFNLPVGTAADTNGNVYVTDFANNLIRKLTPQGTNWVVTTVAGLAGSTGGSDGTNSVARFNQPFGIAVDSSRNLFITDSGNDCIRKAALVGTNWVVTTLAGSPGASGSSDGVGAAARFSFPYGVAVDAARNLFVIDYGNQIVRQGKIAPLVELALSGNQAVLSWPNGLTGYVLQTSSNASGGPWSLLTNGVAVVGDNSVLTTNLQPGAVFFRLRKQLP